jgi:hypothetical protein
LQWLPRFLDERAGGYALGDVAPNHWPRSAWSRQRHIPLRGPEGEAGIDDFSYLHLMVLLPEETTPTATGAWSSLPAAFQLSERDGHHFSMTRLSRNEGNLTGWSFQTRGTPLARENMAEEEVTQSRLAGRLIGQWLDQFEKELARA